MKKLMVLGLTMAMLMGITACGDNSEETKEIDEIPVVEQAQAEEPKIISETLTPDQTQEKEPIAENESEVSSKEIKGIADYTEEEWDNLNEEEQYEIMSKFYEKEFGPQPTKEELEIVEAELRHEAVIYKDNVMELAQNYLDILFSDDTNYTEDDRIADLVNNGIIQEGSEWNFYGSIARYQGPGANRIYEYTLKDVLYADEMIEYFGEGNPYSERRNQVGFEIVVDVKDKGALESEVRDSTYTMLMVGSFYEGIFKMNTQW